MLHTTILFLSHHHRLLQLPVRVQPRHLCRAEQSGTEVRIFKIFLPVSQTSFCLSGGQSRFWLLGGGGDTSRTNLLSSASYLEDQDLPGSGPEVRQALDWIRRINSNFNSESQTWKTFLETF